MKNNQTSFIEEQQSPISFMHNPKDQTDSVQESDLHYFQMTQVRQPFNLNDAFSPNSIGGYFTRISQADTSYV